MITKSDAKLGEIKKHIEQAKEKILKGLSEDLFDEYRNSYVDRLYEVAHDLHTILKKL